MQDGNALQGATSHTTLGQTFAHSRPDIGIFDKDGTLKSPHFDVTRGMSTAPSAVLSVAWRRRRHDHAAEGGAVSGRCPALPRDDADKAKILRVREKVQKDLRAKRYLVQIDKSDGVHRIKCGLQQGRARSPRTRRARDRRGVLVLPPRPGQRRQDQGVRQRMRVKIAEALDAMQKDLLAKSRAHEGMIKDVKTLKVRDFFAAEQTGGLKLDYSLIKGSEEIRGHQRRVCPLRRAACPLTTKARLSWRKRY